MAQHAEARPFPAIETANIAIAICSGSFIAVLALAAYWDPSIRVLHLFESLPYLLAIVLCLRNYRAGYALALAAGAFWLWTAGILTSFVRSGFARLMVFLATGQVDRPDILIAVPAALATGGLCLCALWGYARLPRKSWSDIGVAALALSLMTGWFLAIFALFAPRYLGMFRQLFS